MPGFPLPMPTQFEDANGDPLAGGLLYTYEAGTSTPLATYSDEGLTVPNANPTVLDAGGMATIYVGDGVAYKLVLRTSLGVLVWTRDNWSVPEIEPAPTPAEVPVGAILPYGGSSAPTDYLLCDGSAVSRTTYADLFGIIGTTFGPGNGSTTFNVPDLRGRYPFGVSTSGTGNTLGATFGTIDHVHTGPSHTHTIASHTHTITHTHTVPYNGWTTQENTPPLAGILQAGGSGIGSETAVTQATASQNSGGSSAANSGSTALTTDAEGTGNTGTANPPSLAVNFIIKT